jgi:SAM-dependent methyltransferase
MISPAQWPPAFEQLDQTARDYYHFHRMRFGALVAKAVDCVRRIGSGELQILDIGPGFQTPLLQRQFPECRVNTLGYEDVRFREGVRGSHFDFDLNKCGDARARPPVPPQDLIVMAEVIEHLHVPPQHVMACLSSWLRPGGELLLQTPNAVSFAKRLRIMRGYNPFMMPREPGDTSGHVREYTVGELIEIGEGAGLAVRDVAVLNYFAHATRRGQFYRRVCSFFPANLRDGITICYSKLRPGSQ